MKHLLLILTVMSLLIIGCGSETEVVTTPPPQAPAPEPEAPEEPPAEDPAPVDEPDTAPQDPEPEVQEEPGTLLLAASEVPSGSTQNIEFNGREAIVINFGGEYFGYYNKCPHSGGPSLLEDDDKLRCQWHGQTFQPTTGEYVSGPAPGKPLESFEVVEQDGNLYGLE